MTKSQEDFQIQKLVEVLIYTLTYSFLSLYFLFLSRDPVPLSRDAEQEKKAAEEK
jgi:hypothetical protein